MSITHSANLIAASPAANIVMLPVYLELCCSNFGNQNVADVLYLNFSKHLCKYVLNVS